ncbi:MAG TPA: beta-ketoacyl synthase N-terminal-like domain-containing protein, partial [Actinomycetota bacterium]|nr:beta-ketoacyl synthase N-terminal-like domain-containing protein [Actinomycetota bacterium]
MSRGAATEANESEVDMETRDERIAIVGVGAILPDAPTAAAFWENVRRGRYSITETPPDRWDPELYYDPDPRAPDKTYSKIGGWVRDFEWDPLGWRLPIPPLVADAMDDGQKWALACTREALFDYGYPERPLDEERTAVILGNAMAGEKHYLTAFRIMFPELAEELERAPSFMALTNDVQAAIVSELRTGIGKRFPEITEDTMPGELANILAGRIANLNNFRGPSFTTDAACASGLAAISAAVHGLRAGDFDSVITGGVDRNMGIAAFVKFCKIGALSATGTRPYAEGADGFVMGEGAAVFLLKRLSDAERDGDRVHAVLVSLAGSSDGRGKGITAPNPIGQRLAVERAWRAAGVAPSTATLVEGHGTSTAVGDLVEMESLQAAFGDQDLVPGSIPLGSVKSNIGHLKSAAGAAGLLKTMFALRDGVLPPSLNFARPNHGIDWAGSPFRVNTELTEWERPPGGVRRAGVSAFGFGGTNFHAVLEEHVPGARRGGGRAVVAVPETAALPKVVPTTTSPGGSPKPPLRGAVVIGAETAEALRARLATVAGEAGAGRAPAPGVPEAADLRAPERLAIDYGDAADLATKAGAALKALAGDDPATWRALKGRGIFRGSGPAPKVAFLYTGQGSQYANMLRSLRDAEPIVAETFAEADRVMAPLLDRPLSEHVFVDPDDPAAMGAAELDLMRTEITQPAVLATDLALTRLLAAYGVRPDMVMGHSLGEYGALVAAGALTFEHALEAVSARGREMASLAIEDNGKMAAIVAPLPEIERIVGAVDGYIEIANLNSNGQAVIGGASDAVDRAVEAFTEAGFQAIPLPVSHAFHTAIVAPASRPLREALVRLELRPPALPIVANVSGEFYPTEGDVTAQMLDILAAQVASPVQFVKGLLSLYEAGARAFVEVGPKKALSVFAEDVLGERGDALTLFTNHPKVGDLASFNQALCGLYAAGLGAPAEAAPTTTEGPASIAREPAASPATPVTAPPDALVALFDEFRQRARDLVDRPAGDGGPERAPEVVVTGAALGLPGTEHVFDDGNVGRILRGEQLIGPVPEGLRRAMLDKHVTRLVKRENGDPTFETIDDAADVIKVAGRAGAFDLEAEFGVDADRIAALDRATELAIAAGFDALRDAGIPLVPKYRVTTKGTKLPEGWTLPEEIGDDTGVIFASAFPGYDAFVDEVNRFHEDRGRRTELRDLERVRERIAERDGHAGPALEELDRRIGELRMEIDAHPYRFDRRFLFKALPMGHSQFAEIVGARGPNTQINSACASTT